MIIWDCKEVIFVNLWLLLFIVLIIIELLTVNLTTIWFAFGSLVAYILSFFVSDIMIQTIIFLVSSIILLIFTRPIVKKFLLNKDVKTNADMLIGKTCVVTKEITKNEVGEVKVNGQYWSAKANKKIKVGSEAKILSIEGVKLIVKEKEED